MLKISLTISGARPSDGSSSISSFGLRHQRAAQRQHLPLAAGQRAGELVAPLRETRKAPIDVVERRASPPRVRTGVAGTRRARDCPRRSCPRTARAAREPAPVLARRAARPTAGRPAHRDTGSCRAKDCSPMIAPSDVVLPAPFGPITVTMRPSSTVERQLVHGLDLAVEHREVAHFEQRRRHEILIGQSPPSSPLRGPSPQASSPRGDASASSPRRRGPSVFVVCRPGGALIRRPDKLRALRDCAGSRSARRWRASRRNPSRPAGR